MVAGRFNSSTRPLSSLNPVRTIGDTLRAPLLHHKLVRAGARRPSGRGC